MSKIEKTSDDHEQDNSSLGVSKRYLVMYEDGQYYGSFSPLAIYETEEAAEIAAYAWLANNKGKVMIEEVDYNAY